MRSTHVLWITVLSLQLIGPAAGQWVSFEDQTGSRLTLSSVPTNDAEEKDVAAADLDQDGWTDLVVVRKVRFSNPGAKTDLLLMNNGGVLEDKTSVYAAEFLTNPTDARDVFIVDVDTDGWDDVVIASTFGDSSKLYRNLGDDAQGDWIGLSDESWRLPPAGVPVVQFCAVWGGDVNGDGAPDLYMSNYVGGGTALDILLINNGSGVFTDESAARLGNLRNSAFGTSVEIHDVDNDGDNDIVKISTLNAVSPWNDQGVFILFNTGAGFFSTFQKVPSNQPYMFTYGDWNGDNLLDAYVVDDFLDYTDMATGVVPDTSVTYTQTVLNSAPRTNDLGGNVKAADLDGDGDLDVGVAPVDVDIQNCPPHPRAGELALLENQGGIFSDPTGTSQPWNSSAFDFAFLDINKDGATDLFLANCDGYAVFMQENLVIPFPVSSTAISSTRIDVWWTDRSIGEDGTEIERRLNRTYAAPRPVAQVGVAAAAPGIGVLVQMAPSALQYCLEQGFVTSVTLEMSDPRPGAYSLWENGAWQTASDASVIYMDNLVCRMDYNPLATVGPNVVDYFDLGLIEGRTYDYQVRSFDGADFTIFLSTSASTPAVLAAPSALAVTAVGSGTVDLAWTDNSTGELGTSVERRDHRTYPAPKPVFQIGIETEEFGLPLNLVKIFNRSAKQFCLDQGFVDYEDYDISEPSGAGDHTWWDGSSWQNGNSLFVIWMQNLRCRSDWAEVAVANEDVTTFVDDTVQSGTDTDFRVRAFYDTTFTAYSNVVSTSVP